MADQSHQPCVPWLAMAMQGRGRRGGLPVPLLVLIILACGLLAYNIFSWKELPLIFSRLGKGIAAYKPSEHTVLGTAHPSPPPATSQVQ